MFVPERAMFILMPLQTQPTFANHLCKAADCQIQGDEKLLFAFQYQ